MQTHVTLIVESDIAFLTFACEQEGKPATLDWVVLDELDERLTSIEAQMENLRAVLVRSEPEKYFIVGANILALEQHSAETMAPWVQRGHEVFNRLAALPVPVLARADGYTLGGGLELAMACDMIIASNKAKFGQPEARLGFVAGWGGSYRLPRRVGISRAKEMFFTGKTLTAREALAIGLVDFVGDADEIDAYLDSFFHDLRQCSRLAVAEMKRLIDLSSTMTLAQSATAEAVSSVACISSGDTKKRVQAFLDSRKKR